MFQKKHENPTKPKSIGFRDGRMKDEISRILKEPALQELMPEDVKGVEGLMTHWAVCKLKELLDKGRLETPLPMFAPESAETIGMREEIDRLKQRCSMYHSAINTVLIPLIMGAELPHDELVNRLKKAQNVVNKAATWEEFKKYMEL